MEPRHSRPRVHRFCGSEGTCRASASTSIDGLIRCVVAPEGISAGPISRYWRAPTSLSCPERAGAGSGGRTCSPAGRATAQTHADWAAPANGFEPPACRQARQFTRPAIDAPLNPQATALRTSAPSRTSCPRRTNCDPAAPDRRQRRSERRVSISSAICAPLLNVGAIANLPDAASDNPRRERPYHATQKRVPACRPWMSDTFLRGAPPDAQPRSSRTRPTAAQHRRHALAAQRTVAPQRQIGIDTRHQAP